MVIKMIEKIKVLAKDYELELIRIRRVLHMVPECGFDLEKTSALVFNKLTEFGYTPRKCGKSGVVAEVGCGRRCILLRADMDGLKMMEEAEISFKSTNGNMHSCGHDMHTAMLLGCARILKLIENELDIKVRLMFQPAEEILEGAKDMIDDNVLEDVCAAVMIHVSSGTNLKSGSIIIPNSGIAAPSCDYFEIEVLGSGGHSGMPKQGNNPIIPAAEIIQGLYEMNEDAIITVGSLNAGVIANVIPSVATIRGTIRCYSADSRVKAKIKLNDIILSSSKKYNVEASLKYTNSCPPLFIDEDIKKKTHQTLMRHFGDSIINISDEREKESGSEDFAYVSNYVPTILLSLSAGSKEEGYLYPLHNPKVMFNDDVIKIGSILYSIIAYELLKQ